MNQPPFRLEQQLCHSLEVVIENGVKVARRTATPARQSTFPRRDKDYLPGEPRIPLDGRTIGGYLKEELVARDLEQLAPYLWLVAKQDSSHVSSLTHQLARGREIVITEKPGLHLVWYYDRVFIKPLPKYLLSHAFWSFYLLSHESPIPEPLRSDLKKAALGFLRSYAFLIQHRSDFDLAMREEHRLLPKNVKYVELAKLLRSVECIDDSMVSLRYNYGELRLSRLNFWVKIFLFRFTYHKSQGQYGAYFSRFLGPLAALFAILSVLLSAMQVSLAALEAMDNSNLQTWRSFAKVSNEFAIFVLFSAGLSLAFLLILFLTMLFREAIYAFKDLYYRKKGSKQGVRGTGHRRIYMTD
jgi:hypothetical protein